MSTTTVLGKPRTSELSLVAVFRSGVAQSLFPEIHAYPASRSVNIYLTYLETGNYPEPPDIDQRNWLSLSPHKRHRARVGELFSVMQRIQGQTLREMTAFIKWCGSDDAAVIWAARNS